MLVMYKKYSDIEAIFLTVFTKTPSRIWDTAKCHWISVGKEQPKQYLC